jgi:hypothetical protein
MSNEFLTTMTWTWHPPPRPDKVLAAQGTAGTKFPSINRAWEMHAFREVDGNFVPAVPWAASTLSGRGGGCQVQVIVVTLLRTTTFGAPPKWSSVSALTDYRGTSSQTPPSSHPPPPCFGQIWSCPKIESTPPPCLGQIRARLAPGGPAGCWCRVADSGCPEMPKPLIK